MMKPVRLAFLVLIIIPVVVRFIGPDPSAVSITSPTSTTTNRRAALLLRIAALRARRRDRILARTDIDECDRGTDTCDDNARCTNTPGSFECFCDPGFTGDGMTCTDIDECDEVTNMCNGNATCTNTPGSFECSCDPGFTGDGMTCTDIDECDEVTDLCDGNATCTNTPGSFECSCDPGFTGDGFLCTAVVMCTALPEVVAATVTEVDVSDAAPGFTVPFTCNRFFTQNGANGTLTCNNNGNFTPDITCESCTAFQYNVTANTTINFETFRQENINSEPGCTDICNRDASCQIPLFISIACLGLPDSFIEAFINFDQNGPLICQSRCTLNQNCLSYAILDIEGFEACFLSELSLENLVVISGTLDMGTSERDQLGDKVSCV